MTLHRRPAAASPFSAWPCRRPFPIDGTGSGGRGFVPSAHAQFIRNLIARLRGETLPDGVVKSNGRIEATQVDVSSKYPGRLSEVTVEEGSSVTQGQVIARITSPEYEAQLRAAKARRADRPMTRSRRRKPKSPPVRARSSSPNPISSADRS